MAKNTISGLTITIGADTKQFTDAIKKIDTEARNIAKNLKTINENLKIDPTNTQKAADSLKLLQDQASKAGEKVKLFQEAIAKLNKEYADKKVTTDEYNESLKNLTMLLSQAQNEQDLANTKIRQFGQETETASGHVLTMGDLIKSNLISDAIKSGLQAIVDLAKKIGDTIWKTLKNISTGIKNFVGDGLKIAEENRQTLAKVGQVFGENKQEIVDWSKQAVTSFGMTAGEAQAAAATFGNMFTALDVSDEEAAKMSMDLVQLAADVGAFNNVTTDSVLENFQSGLAGTSRQLRQYGIVLNAAQIEAKALEQTGKESKDDLTEGEKIVARYALMMEQAAKQSGQFARESDSATVQTQILGARIKELKGEIGEKLIPVQARLYAMANELLSNPAVLAIFDSVIDKVGKLANAFKALFDDVHFDDLSGSFANVFGTLMDKARMVLPSVLQFGGELLQSLIEGMNKYLPLIAADLIPVTTALFNTLVTNLPDIVEAATTLLKTFGDAISTNISVIAPVCESVLKDVSQYLRRNMTDITDAALDILMALADGLIIALPELIPAAAQLIVSIVDTITDNLPEITEKAWDIVKAIAKGLAEAVGVLITGVEDLLTDALMWIVEHKDEIIEFGKKIPSYIWEGIKSMKDWFAENWRSWLDTLIGSFDFSEEGISNARAGHEKMLAERYGWVGEAEGGPVSAGRLYRVNDDAGRRTEWFIPNQDGYVLNGNQTDRIINNTNNSRSMGDINIYVSSYGMNVAEVADELGAAFQQRVRMSGAFL